MTSRGALTGGGPVLGDLLPKEVSRGVIMSRSLFRRSATDPTPLDDWDGMVRRDGHALRESADEGGSLYSRCPSASAYQSSAWASSWWRPYGGSGSRGLTLVRSRG